MASPLLVDILSYWNLNDNGSGDVSLVDSTGNGYTLTNNNGVTLGTGIIGGDGVFNGVDQWLNNASFPPFNSGDFTVSYWFNTNSLTAFQEHFSTRAQSTGGFHNDFSIGTYLNVLFYYDGGAFIGSTSFSPSTWYNIVTTNQSGTLTFYINGSVEGTLPATLPYLNPFVSLGAAQNGTELYNGQLDEIGVWNRALSPTEVSELYNGGMGITYPFSLSYNNAQNDGDWGNLLNWWQDSAFTVQATALPDSTTSVILYNQVTQNTQGANQCFCASANFWSADFAYGLTLQSTGVVNMQGTSVMAGATTDGISMHDSSTLTDTSSVTGDVTMRDSSRAYGYIGGNAYVYYDQGNGQFPIGGIVAGTVSYLGWPAVTPQWFNDNNSVGGAGDGDFSNKANWWTSNSYTTRPINAEGTQELPDASTDVFIGDNINLNFNTGPSITVNTITGSSSGLGYNTGNLTLTVTNGVFLSNYSVMARVTLYGNVTFDTGAFVFESVINGTATYTSAASLQYSWQGSANSLGNLNEGATYGSTGFVVNISGGGGTSLGTNWISRLLHLPWFINV